MILNDPSPEQLNIVNNLHTYNVVTDSVAGSGKTTTVLHISKTFHQKNILLLTYNKKLKIETKLKKDLLNIKNLEVHTYHSFCCKSYNPKCQTDYIILDILKKNIPTTKPTNYDFIILDEAQDMTPLYYELIYKIIKDNKQLPKICILGDRFQSIYKYNNADERFIIYASKLFNINEFCWKETKLSTSYRLTFEMVDFLNKSIIKQNRLNATKHGPLPRYICTDCFDNDRPFEEIQHYLKNHKPEDIFILAPSVRSEMTPVRKLANRISEEGIKIYVPNSDEERISDSDILKGKIVFSTYHQAKGLERPVVVIFGIDDSYLKYYNKSADPFICPNEIYVALTRAKEKMTIFHHFTNGYLPFIDIPNLKSTCYHELKTIKSKPSKFIKNTKPIGVTDLLRHLPSEVVENALTFFNCRQIGEKGTLINIPIKTGQSDGLYESVSDITGIAIPAYFELQQKGTMAIYNTLSLKLEFDSPKINNKVYMFDDANVEDNLTNIDLKNLSIEQLLLISNKYNAFVGGYIHKVIQIGKYDWLSEENLNECVGRLGNFVSNDAIFEKKFTVGKEMELFGSTLTGFVDCIDGDIIYEFKCVHEIKPEHFLQLAVYSYLVETNRKQYIDGLAFEINRLEGISTSKQILSYGMKISFNKDDTILSGTISHLYKNGTINVKVDKKIHHVSTNNIIFQNPNQTKINNLTNEMILLSEHKFMYRLFNILTNEMYELTFNLDNLCKMVEYIILNKNKNGVVDNTTFVSSALARVSKYELEYVCFRHL